MSGWWSFLIVLCALPGVAWSQEPPQPSAAEEPVALTADPAPEEPVAQTVVTASRSPERLDNTPVATEVITRAEIVASGARDAAELLAAHPGLEVASTFAGSNLRIQGLGSEYALVLVDGERVTGRVNGAIDLTRLSMEDVEQVEIVKGPSSVLYGSDAVAGVVNFITRQARKPLGADLRLSYGSLQWLDLDATAEAQREAWGLRVSGGVQRRDAYDLEPLDISTTGSSLSGFNVSARGDLKREGPLELSSTVSYERRVQRGVDLGATGAIFDRASRDDELTVRLSPAWRLSDSVTLRTDGHYTGFKRRYVNDQRQASALDTVEDTRDQLARLGSQLDARLGERHALVAGVELLGEHLVSGRLDDEKGERGRLSLYAQDSWTVLAQPNLALVPGVRLDVDSQFGPAVTPRLALRIDPLSALTLRASYGWGLRAPSFQELLLDFENPAVGYTVRGNPDLKPERSRSLSLSVEVRPASASLLWLNLFQHSLRDMISYNLEQTPEGMRFIYANLDRASVRGGEVGVRQKLPGGVLLDVGYTLIDGRDRETDEPLEGQARHRVTGQVTWRFRPWGLETWVRGALVGSRPFYPDTDGDGVANPYRAKSYVTLDARISRQLPAGLRLFVAGSNLLEAGNTTDLPIPPRLLQAGISAQF
ncbi:TonB-dependent receptor plug domain-containing protein [Stigmatella aurantiaca]|uniref:TonB dependent receptor n=1 Tax=Stigmatella aurantiaca (strain DW4/3-1) TaxID=378806 RepID=Q09A84_STIAD|nr:TonB-dependent receptor [Stigmatella aurantiaca]ADO75065.1 TonB dependent receptor [Stigmatella aurantiaca DW4/3-1]EAU68639.1 TonB-dependent outer membrane receptor [Stigmatella aurantiaca DW4/3-1]